jgi:hypothetical protein
MCGFDAHALRTSRWLVLSLRPPSIDEAVDFDPGCHSSLGDTQNELKCFVITEIRRFTVHVQADCGCQPSQAMLPWVNARFVTIRMQDQPL